MQGAEQFVQRLLSAAGAALLAALIPTIRYGWAVKFLADQQLFSCRERRDLICEQISRSHGKIFSRGFCGPERPPERSAGVSHRSGREKPNFQRPRCRRHAHKHTKTTTYQAKATASYATDSAPRRIFSRSFRFCRFRIDSDVARGAGALGTGGPRRFRRRRRSSLSWTWRSRKSSAAAIRASTTSRSDVRTAWRRGPRRGLIISMEPLTSGRPIHLQRLPSISAVTFAESHA